MRNPKIANYFLREVHNQEQKENQVFPVRMVSTEHQEIVEHQDHPAGTVVKETQGEVATQELVVAPVMLEALVLQEKVERKESLDDPSLDEMELLE